MNKIAFFFISVYQAIYNYLLLSHQKKKSMQNMKNKKLMEQITKIKNSHVNDIYYSQISHSTLEKYNAKSVTKNNREKEKIKEKKEENLQKQLDSSEGRKIFQKNNLTKSTKPEDNYEREHRSLNKKMLQKYQLPKIAPSPRNLIRQEEMPFPKFDRKQTESLLDEEINLKNRGSATLELNHKKKSKLEPLLKQPVLLTVTKTRAGMNGQQNKINQDIAIVNMKLPYGMKLFSVCDGHGQNGHLVSAFIKSHLIKNLTSALKKCNTTPEPEKIEEIVYFCLNKTNQQLLDSDINTELSGSTVIVVVVYKNRIFSFNVGDSRAILLRQIQTGNNEEQKQLIKVPKLSHTEQKGKYQWNCKLLSIDQKPERKDQYQRIIKNGGRVYAQTNENGDQLGPLRVWMKDIDMPGLAMTRSFGDKAGIKAGTNGEPEVIEHEIREEDKLIVIASDGVWQYVQNQEVMKAVAGSFLKDDLGSSGEMLLKISCEAWQKMSYSRDDITFIIVKLNDPSK